MRDRKHILFYGISVVLLAVLEAAFFDRLRILQAKPDLVLVFVLLVAVRMEPAEAMGLGAVSGLFLDIVYGRYIGVYALLYMYTAILTAALSFPYLKEKRWWCWTLLPPVFLLYNVAESFVMRAIALYAAKGGKLYAYGYLTHVVRRILPQSLYDLLAMVVLLPLVWLILRKMAPRPPLRYDG